MVTSRIVAVCNSLAHIGRYCRSITTTDKDDIRRVANIRTSADVCKMKLHAITRWVVAIVQTIGNFFLCALIAHMMSAAGVEILRSTSDMTKTHKDMDRDDRVSVCFASMRLRYCWSIVKFCACCTNSNKCSNCRILRGEMTSFVGQVTGSCEIVIPTTETIAQNMFVSTHAT